MDPKAIARRWAAGEDVSPRDISPQEPSTENTHQYLVSIYSETRSVAEDVEDETTRTEVEIDQETIDADTLIRYAQDYGISEASSSHITPNQHSLWFYSVTPQQDRAYFEQGIETYYSLHVHAVDDKKPSGPDYQHVADLIDVRVSPAVSLEPSEIASPQPDHEF